MAALTAPSQHRSLLGAVISAVQGRSGRSRVAQVAAKVREHVVTVAALAAVDVGAWHVPGVWGTVCGCVVLGASILVLDFAVTGK